MPDARFVPIRCGIADYLVRGEISSFELGLYAMIHLQADFSSGVWHGSAKRLQATAPRGAKLREIQRGIEHLTDLGFLKPFHVQGQRGNYPVLIDDFVVRSGALKGHRLNASDSTSWRTPSYEVCADDVADVRAEDAPIQEVRSKTNKKSKPFSPAKPAGESQEFLSFWNAYPKKLGRQEARKAWDKAGCEGRLGDVLASLTAWKKTEQWTNPQYIPYPATWLNKGLWKESPRPVASANGPSLMDERRRLEAKIESGGR